MLFSNLFFAHAFGPNIKLFETHEALQVLYLADQTHYFHHTAQKREPNKTTENGTKYNENNGPESLKIDLSSK